MTTLVLALFALGLGVAVFLGGRQFYAYCAGLRRASAIVVAGIVVLVASFGSCGAVMAIPKRSGPPWVVDLLGFLTMLTCLGGALVLFGIVMMVGDRTYHERPARSDVKPDIPGRKPGSSTHAVGDRDATEE